MVYAYRQPDRQMFVEFVVWYLLLFIFHPDKVYKHSSEPYSSHSHTLTALSKHLGVVQCFLSYLQLSHWATPPETRGVKWLFEPTLSCSCWRRRELDHFYPLTSPNMPVWDVNPLTHRLLSCSPCGRGGAVFLHLVLHIAWDLTPEKGQRDMFLEVVCLFCLYLKAPVGCRLFFRGFSYRPVTNNVELHEVRDS